MLANAQKLRDLSIVNTSSSSQPSTVEVISPGLNKNQNEVKGVHLELKTSCYQSLEGFFPSQVQEVQ